MRGSKGPFDRIGAFGTISQTKPKTQLAVVLMVQQPTKKFPLKLPKS